MTNVLRVRITDNCVQSLKRFVELVNHEIDHGKIIEGLSVDDRLPGDVYINAALRLRGPTDKPPSADETKVMVEVEKRAILRGNIEPSQAQISKPLAEKVFETVSTGPDNFR